MPPQATTRMLDVCGELKAPQRHVQNHLTSVRSAFQRREWHLRTPITSPWLISMHRFCWHRSTGSLETWTLQQLRCQITPSRTLRCCSEARHAEPLHFGGLCERERVCKSLSLSLTQATGSLLISSQGCQSRLGPGKEMYCTIKVEQISAVNVPRFKLTWNQN